MRFLSTETKVTTPECAFGDERGGARRATPLQLWGSLFTISRLDMSFLWAQAMKQIAAFIVSMPRDRNGSKALIPHGFVVIFYRVVAMKGLCVEITIYVVRRIEISPHQQQVGCAGWTHAQRVLSSRRP